MNNYWQQWHMHTGPIECTQATLLLSIVMIWNYEILAFIKGRVDAGHPNPVHA